MFEIFRGAHKQNRLDTYMVVAKEFNNSLCQLVEWSYDPDQGVVGHLVSQLGVSSGVRQEWQVPVAYDLTSIYRSWNHYSIFS